MRPIEYIRKKVFGVNQAEFAAISGATQPTVSRWERGTLRLSDEQMTRIRAAARERGLPWSDSYFFDNPPEEAA